MLQLFAISLVTLTGTNTNAETKVEEKLKEEHSWEQVHVHTEEQLVDKYKKKVKTIAYHHYHDVHVYRTIQVFTYYCPIHNEYKSVVDISNKREEEQPH